VVDFLAPKQRLVIEIDGPYHAQRRRAAERRDVYLRCQGYRVIRFEADMVEDYPNIVVELIRGALKEAA
jgi:very-short-patch-repair endonuclease